MAGSTHRLTLGSGMVLLQVLLLLLLLLPGHQSQTSNYYCQRSMCPTGDAHVGCYAELPFGKSCQGQKPQLVPMTPERKAMILQQHNRQRQRLALGTLPGYGPAYHMPQLYWDDELQYLAEVNARSCVYAHDHCRNTYSFPRAGQNIAIIRHFGLNLTKESVYTYIIDHWYNEYPLATTFVDKYPVNYVGPEFAHFTQIVNDRAVRMGCGMVSWETYNGYVWTNDYLVCNYGYSNVIGDRSYTKGPVAAGCTTGRSVVYPGLCL